MRKTWIAVAACVVLVSMWIGPQTTCGEGKRGQPGVGRGAPALRPPKKWNESEYVFTGKLDRVDAGPVGQSMPPMYTHTLHFTVEKVLRGPLKPGEEVACSHVARQHKRPVFPNGKVCLVAASKSRGHLRVEIVEPASDTKLKDVELACSLPIGWKVEDGKPISPWASLGKNAWSATTDLKSKVVDGKTGRPALMADSGVTFQVESVPPKQAIKWTNPDGDGEYKITVTNSTDKPIVVPALLSDGDKILWKESLVILCQNKVYLCPGCQGVSGKVQGTELGPGQSVSTTVNVLRLEGPTWPRGGYRIEFRFCLGEKSQTKSLYYMSRHHDKLRKAVSK